ncbi:unnamed protein product [Mytilus coruscus]|uniref:Uncharacterized protein n=1 Tax=Mytilus coruscus TaxID=42192 RepID=A0A6J8ADG7_MYTCO|nr:unnamed protein product [Mytilus coruscus]
MSQIESSIEAKIYAKIESALETKVKEEVGKMKKDIQQDVDQSKEGLDDAAQKKTTFSQKCKLKINAAYKKVYIDNDLPLETRIVQNNMRTIIKEMGKEQDIVFVGNKLVHKHKLVRLRLGVWNCRGWSTRRNDNSTLRRLVLEHTNRDILAICESFLREEEQLSVPGQKGIGPTRTNLHRNAVRGSGGVSALIRSKLFNSFDIGIIDTSVERILTKQLNLLCLLEDTLQMLRFEAIRGDMGWTSCFTKQRTACIRLLSRILRSDDTRLTQKITELT